MEVSGRRLDTDSDNLSQVLCSPCQADGNHLDAQGFCETCRQYLCDQCFKCHTVAGPMKHHVLVDKSRMPLDLSDTHSDEAGICNDICINHEGRYIEYFCEGHIQLACSVCVTLNHPDCKGKVSYIPKVAKPVDDNEEYKDMIQHLNDMQTAVEMMKKRYKHNAKSIHQEGNEDAKILLQLKEDMTCFIDDIAGNMQDKFESVRKEKMTLMQKQVDSCDDGITAIDEFMRNMERKEKQRAALFVAVKTGLSQVERLQKQIAVLEQDEVILSNKFVPIEKTVALVKDRLTNFLGNFQSVTQFGNNEDFTQQLMPDVTAIQRQLKDTEDKVNLREATIQKLNADLVRLKSKHQDKLLEINKHMQTIKTQEDYIKQCGRLLDKMGKIEGECTACKTCTRDHTSLPCGHVLCWKCLEQLPKAKLPCPVCRMVKGNQPDGEMQVTEETVRCWFGSGPGIVVKYKFRDGVQGRDHPNPGAPFRGREMRAFLLPDENGRKLLTMLRIAFDRKLLFTVRNSRVEQENEIEHWTDTNLFASYPWNAMVCGIYRRRETVMREVLVAMGIPE